MTGIALNWLQRGLVALLSAAIFVLGFFFLTVALVAGALIALAVIVRWWWLARKLQRARAQGTLEGEYEVVERAGSDPIKLPRDRP
jgi:membrane protein implicated in regulation of membrane protease activity